MMLALIFFPIVLIVLFFIVSPRPSHFNIAGSHVLITGGSSGIGLELAKEFAKKGGFITLAARNKQKLLEAKTIVEQHMKGGGERQCVMILPLDVSSSAKEVQNHCVGTLPIHVYHILFAITHACPQTTTCCVTNKFKLQGYLFSVGESYWQCK